MALTLQVQQCEPGEDFLLADIVPRNVPRLPGIYIAWHPESRTCLYIGRSSCLQDRVGSQRRHNVLSRMRRDLARMFHKGAASPST